MYVRMGVYVLDRVEVKEKVSLHSISPWLAFGGRACVLGVLRLCMVDRGCALVYF